MKNIQYNYVKPLWRSGRKVTRRQWLNIWEQYDQNHNTTTVFFGLLPGTGSERQGENKNVEEKRKEGDEKKHS